MVLTYYQASVISSIIQIDRSSLVIHMPFNKRSLPALVRIHGQEGWEFKNVVRRDEIKEMDVRDVRLCEFE